MLEWATPVLVLVEITERPHDHQPRSSDPQFCEVWLGPRDRPVEWRPIVTDWTGTPPREGAL